MSCTGSSWVGWNNASHPQPVQMTFEFDSVRNFSAMYLYMNNQFDKDVQVRHFFPPPLSDGEVCMQLVSVVTSAA